MKKKTTRKKTILDKTKISSVPYTASIKILGKLYKSTGKTVSDALTNLEVKNARGVGILTVSKGDISKERILNHNQVFRLFTPSRVMREVAIKNTSILFGI